MTRTYEIDHIFVCASPNAPERKVFERHGLKPSSSGRHPGQGTANICYNFGQSYLELLWQDDETDIRSGITAPTGLWERCNWQETGASRFGIAIRGIKTNSLPPFPCWQYQPDYLPGGRSIPIAEASRDFREPLIFFISGGRQFSEKIKASKEKFPNILYQRTQGDGENEALQMLAELGLVQTATSGEEKITLSVASLKTQIDLTPDVPLVMVKD